MLCFFSQQFKINFFFEIAFQFILHLHKFIHMFIYLLSQQICMSIYSAQGPRNAAVNKYRWWPCPYGTYFLAAETQNKQVLCDSDVCQEENWTECHFLVPVLVLSRQGLCSLASRVSRAASLLASPVPALLPDLVTFPPRPAMARLPADPPTPGALHVAPNYLTLFLGTRPPLPPCCSFWVPLSPIYMWPHCPHIQECTLFPPLFLSFYFLPLYYDLVSCKPCSTKSPAHTELLSLISLIYS